MTRVEMGVAAEIVALRNSSCGEKYHFLKFNREAAKGMEEWVYADSVFSRGRRSEVLGSRC